MVKFLILTTQRSGASFFRTWFDSHPQIQCPGTVFPQVSTLKFFQVDRQDSIYYNYRLSSQKRKLAHWFQRKKLVCACLNDYFRSVSSNAKAVGFKLSYNHVKKYPAIAGWIYEHDVRIIHFIRRNVLKTVLSLETAKKRMLYHSTKKINPVKVYLHPRKLKRKLTRLTRLVEGYRAMFAARPYLEVCYESFVANRDAETEMVLEFLGVDDYAHLETALVKLNPDSIEDIIENYDEVVKALEGTVFEKYLTI